MSHCASLSLSLLLMKLPIREMNVPASVGTYRLGLDESYRPLPSLYLAFFSFWFVSACSWTFNTFKNRHFQVTSHSVFFFFFPFLRLYSFQ